MRLRDLYEEIDGGQSVGTTRVVPRVKTRASTSLCAGNCRSYAAAARRSPTAYVFDRKCFCTSPEAHSAQFLAPGEDGTGH